MEYGANVNPMWCGNGARVRWKLDGNGMALHVNKIPAARLQDSWLQEAHQNYL